MTEDPVAPRTAAGKRLLDITSGADIPQTHDWLPKAILAIEAEAASLDRDEARYAAVMEDNVNLRADRDELRKAVEALENPFDETSEFVTEFMQAQGFEKGRFAVLALLSAGDKAEAPG